MTTKAKSDSIRKKLSNLAHKLDVPYRNLETVFLIERLVARLVADKKLSQQLVFKCGFASFRLCGALRIQSADAERCRHRSLRYDKHSDINILHIFKQFS